MLDSLTLDQMRIFAAIGETDSFSGAARRLGRMQPRLASRSAAWRSHWDRTVRPQREEVVAGIRTSR
jgi:DNA-binding transcriptional LysR family regulator